MTPPTPWSPDRRDIIWIDFNPHVGAEMRDVHPLLVLSTRAFSARTGLVIGLPMTTARFNDHNPFAIKFTGPAGKISYILTEQPKSFDWRRRNARPHPLKQAPLTAYTMACESLNLIIDLR